MGSENTGIEYLSYNPELNRNLNKFVLKGSLNSYKYNLASH